MLCHTALAKLGVAAIGLAKNREMDGADPELSHHQKTRRRVVSLRSMVDKSLQRSHGMGKGGSQIQNMIV